MEYKYYVEKGHSIVVKRGVIGPNEEIKQSECPNLKKLVKLGWVRKEEIEVKAVEQEAVEPEKEKLTTNPDYVEPENVEPEQVPEKPKRVYKKKTSDKKPEFGAQKKEVK